MTDHSWISEREARHRATDLVPWGMESSNPEGEEERVLAVLKATRALVEHGTPITDDLACHFCDDVLGVHKPDCKWQALVAAMGGGEA